MLELNKQELEALIAEGKTVVVDFWKDNCPFCDKYKPVFEVAEAPDTIFVKSKMTEFPYKFGKLTMKTAPFTVSFKGGQPIDMQTGYMDETQMAAYLTDGSKAVALLKAEKEAAPVAPVAPQPPKHRTIKEVPTTELEALAYRNIRIIERAQGELQQINQELNARNAI